MARPRRRSVPGEIQVAAISSERPAPFPQPSTRVWISRFFVIMFCTVPRLIRRQVADRTTNSFIHP